MNVEVGWGEAADRLCILLLKAERLPDPAARTAVAAQAARLRERWDAPDPPDALPQWSELAATNAALWDVEDRLRVLEARSDHDAEFVSLARSVLRLNDARSRLKRSIDADLGSDLVEHKAYGVE